MGFFDAALNPFGIGDAFQKNMTGGAPKKSYYGGTEQQLADTRAEYGGIGQANTAAAGSTLGTAASQAQTDRNAAYQYGTVGTGIGQAGIAGQNQAVANARKQAAQSTDSLAQLQLQQAQDQNARQMMGMASAARGGNQAAAMRNAQAVGAQNQLVTNQQAAQLRAAEQQAALNRQLGVEQMAAGIGGQQAGLGYGMTGQGIGLAQNSTGQLGQIGGAQGSLGLGAYGLLNDVNKTQLETDRGWASADAMSKNKAATMGAIFGGIGSFMG